MKDLVSIVVPLYNSALYIEKCVRSCLEQTYENIEVVVVDDGSTDDGLNVVNGIMNEDERVKVFHKENGGVSSARNIGIEKANGEYVCFVDADDCLDEDFIESMVGCMVENGADFCFSDRIWDKNKNRLNSRVITSAEAEAKLLGTRIPVGCWNKMYNRKCFENIRFDEQLFYGEGLKFIISVAHEASKIVMCNCASYHYRKVNPNSATTKFDLDKMNNGDIALAEIKEIIKNDGDKVMSVWRQHHTLFCLNAMMGILDTDISVNTYTKWRKEFLKDAFTGIVSEAGIKNKLRIVIGIASPRFLHLLSKRRRNE